MKSKVLIFFVAMLFWGSCSPEEDDSDGCPVALYVSYKQAYLTDITADFTAEDQMKAQNEFLVLLATCSQ